MLYGGVNIMTLQSASAGHKMKRPVAYTAPRVRPDQYAYSGPLLRLDKLKFELKFKSDVKLS